jgi:hypothetical protein
LAKRDAGRVTAMERACAAMPKYKNAFSGPEFYEHKIVSEEDGTLIGVLRVKPSSLLWKASGRHQFRSVSMEQFAAWVEEQGKKAAK